MAETPQKQALCSECGENARSEAMFCHLCGGKIVGLSEKEVDSASSVEEKDDLPESKDAESDSKQIDETGSSGVELKSVSLNPVAEDPSRIESTEKQPAADQKNREKSSTSGSTETVKTKTRAKDKKGKKLVSAAELRRKPKPRGLNQVEIVWGEKTESPNWLFLSFGLILAVVAVLMFVLAWYLK